MRDEIIVIGGGLAGTEAALQIAKRKIKVKLYEMKPNKFSPAHSNNNLAEIVCSNSFKSNNITNACGLLKEELRRLGSFLIPIADKVAVPAGQALAVDRERFAEEVTKAVEENEYIEVIREEIEKIPDDAIVIIATGPLTSEKLSEEIKKLTGDEQLHFYDAAAPIIEKSSLDMNIAFPGNRYDQERALDEDEAVWRERVKNQEDSYINLPMNKEEYEAFWNELVKAEIVTLHDFEKKEIFEGCMPVEIMAKRGIDTLRYGPLKPVGFTDPRTGRRPYAVVQLRQDNKEGNLYNIVGFQTNLKFGEQKRVFSMIPGLGNAEFVKYGVMHRNTYIDSTKLLDSSYNMRENPRIFFAGQITGVEGYVESISSGFISGINATKLFHSFFISDMMNSVNNGKILFSEQSVLGALAKYVSSPIDRFQPMNANFGIMPKLETEEKDKKVKYQKMAERSLKYIDEIKNNI